MNEIPPRQSPEIGPVEAVNRRFMKLLEDSGPLTKLWGMIATFNLGVAVLAAAIQIRTNAPMLHELIMNPEVLNQYGPHNPMQSNYFGFVLYPLILLGMTLYYSSFNAFRQAEENPRGFNFADARRMTFSRFVPTALTTMAFFIASALGGACCVIPGLVAMYFLYFAPYLTAAEGRTPLQAIGESVSLSKRHSLLVFLLVAIALVITVGTMAIQFFSLSTFHSMMGDTGILVGSVATWAMGSFVGYFAWLYTGSVFLTVSKSESALSR